MLCVPLIKPQERFNPMPTLNDALNDPKAKIIDVRTAQEHAAQSLTCAHILKPLQELDVDSVAASENLSKDDHLYFLCRMGGRARQAADQFLSKGFINCHVIDGGISACPCEQTQSTPNAKRTIPLDGQVRIAIGIALLFISFADTPLALFLTAGMGGVLIFSGYTGWCGLAMLLARAPWNRAK